MKKTLFSYTQTEIATLTHKFSSVTLYKNKTVRYAARMHAIIACQMEFQLYPMDIQICPIYIESCELIMQLDYAKDCYLICRLFFSIRIVCNIQFFVIHSMPTLCTVSYPNQKVRLQWDDVGVLLNPELKLLQYNLGQPLEVDETIGYMPEKHGNYTLNNTIYNLEI